MIKREEVNYALVLLFLAAIASGFRVFTGLKAYWLIPLLILNVMAAFLCIRRVYIKAALIEQLMSGMREEHTGIDGSMSEMTLLKEDSVFARQLEELKEIGRILNDKEDKREADMKWLKDLMSDITHQMKTPLATLEIYIDTFRSKMEKVLPDSAELADRAVSAMDKMRWLVTGLLKIAQLESGSYVLEKTEVPVKDTVEKSLHALNALMEAKELKVSIECSGDADVTIRQDRDWLQEAFQNILKNAAEYADPGSTIEIGITATPMAVVVSFTDHGEGIAPEELPKIFNRFYRAKHENGERGNGVGIGLALARQIIEAHDGVVTAKSRTGEGAYTSIIASFILNM